MAGASAGSALLPTGGKRMFATFVLEVENPGPSPVRSFGFSGGHVKLPSGRRLFEFTGSRLVFPVWVDGNTFGAPFDGDIAPSEHVELWGSGTVEAPGTCLCDDAISDYPDCTCGRRVRVCITATSQGGESREVCGPPVEADRPSH